MIPFTDILFTVPPGPESEFVEVEFHPQPHHHPLGMWVQTQDGFWALRVPGLSTQVMDVLAERQRQETLGYSSEHDDQHTPYELVNLGKAYVWRYGEVETFLSRMHAGHSQEARREEILAEGRADLVKGIALLLAALERLDRLQTVQDPAEGLGGAESGAERLEQREQEIVALRAEVDAFRAEHGRSPAEGTWGLVPPLPAWVSQVPTTTRMEIPLRSQDDTEAMASKYGPQPEDYRGAGFVKVASFKPVRYIAHTSAAEEKVREMFGSDDQIQFVLDESITAPAGWEIRDLPEDADYGQTDEHGTRPTEAEWGGEG